MEAFEELKSQWKAQKEVVVPKDGAQKLMEIMVGIRKKQRITKLVLSTTVFVLIAFFFYISAFRFQTVMIGLLIMIGVLIVRITLEYFSGKQLRDISPMVEASKYKQQMTTYYNNRRKIHFLFTPIIMMAYGVGFYMLLPGFKVSLSTGFYTYIIISAIVLLVVFSFFIAKQIRKELQVLHNLKE